MLLWSLSPTVQSFTVRRNPSSTSWITRAAAESGKNVLQRNQSAFETRISLVLALASQASPLSQRVLGDLVEETTKYTFPHGFRAWTLEESLMLGQNCECISWTALPYS